MIICCKDHSFEEKREPGPVYDQKVGNITIDAGTIRPPRQEKRSHSTGRRGDKYATIQNKENTYFLPKSHTITAKKHAANQGNWLLLERWMLSFIR